MGQKKAGFFIIQPYYFCKNLEKSDYFFFSLLAFTPC